MYSKHIPAARQWPEALVTPEEIDALLQGSFPGGAPSLPTAQLNPGELTLISFSEADSLHPRRAVSLAQQPSV